MSTTDSHAGQCDPIYVKPVKRKVAITAIRPSLGRCRLVVTRVRAIVPLAMNRRGIFSDPLVLSALSWREIEDAYLLLEEPPNRRFKSERGLLNVDRLDDEMFRSMFRFRKEHIGELQRALLMPETITSAQGVQMDGEEALYVTLRRLAYPNRWIDLEGVFGRHSSVLSSVASKVMLHINNTFGHLLDDLNIHNWLDVAKLEQMSRVRISTPGKTVLVQWRRHERCSRVKTPPEISTFLFTPFPFPPLNLCVCVFVWCQFVWVTFTNITRRQLVWVMFTNVQHASRESNEFNSQAVT